MYKNFINSMNAVLIIQKYIKFYSKKGLLKSFNLIPVFLLKGERTTNLVQQQNNYYRHHHHHHHNHHVFNILFFDLFKAFNLKLQHHQQQNYIKLHQNYNNNNNIDFKKAFIDVTTALIADILYLKKSPTTETSLVLLSSSSSSPLLLSSTKFKIVAGAAAAAAVLANISMKIDFHLYGCYYYCPPVINSSTTLNYRKNILYIKNLLFKNNSNNNNNNFLLNKKFLIILRRMSTNNLNISTTTTTTAVTTNNCNSKMNCDDESNNIIDNNHDDGDVSTNQSPMSDVVKYLELVGSLKHIKRTGWVLRDIKNVESISGHMYRMALMTFLLDSNNVPGLNRIRCMEMALIHDLAECIVGDLTPFCGVSKEDKKHREMEAMKEICNLIQPNGDRMYELFSEYEAGESPESKFVKDLDRLDLVLQAFEYEKRDDCMMKHQEFFDSNEGKFEHLYIKKIVDEIINQREMLSKIKGCTSQMYHHNGTPDYMKRLHNGHCNESINNSSDEKNSS